MRTKYRVIQREEDDWFEVQFSSWPTWTTSAVGSFFLKEDAIKVAIQLEEAMNPNKSRSRKIRVVWPEK